jgi:hypothetical protein
VFVVLIIQYAKRMFRILLPSVAYLTTIFLHLISRRGGPLMVAQWLRYCTTNRKVAGSIPDGVIGIFH